MCRLESEALMASAKIKLSRGEYNRSLLLNIWLAKETCLWEAICSHACRDFQSYLETLFNKRSVLNSFGRLSFCDYIDSVRSTEKTSINASRLKYYCTPSVLDIWSGDYFLLRCEATKQLLLFIFLLLHIFVPCLNFSHRIPSNIDFSI